MSKSLTIKVSTNPNSVSRVSGLLHRGERDNVSIVVAVCF